MRRLVVAIALAGPLVAHADSSVVVTLNSLGQQLASDFGESEQELIQRVHDKIDEIYQTSSIASLLTAFADTTSFADRGVGVDYAMKPGEVMIGPVALGALSNDTTLGTSSHVVAGAVVNFGVMAGANLAHWDLPRWTIFANGFYVQGSIHGLDGHLLTTAAHVQYRIVEPSHPAAVRWIGLDATTGLEYARWTVGASSPIAINFKVTGAMSGQVKTVDLSSTGTLSVIANTVTVPLELTTGVRFGGVLGVYGGGGVDLTAGSATITAALDGDLTINNDHEPIGTAAITASGQSSPTPVTVHALAGLQINTSHVGGFVQGIVSPAATGVSLGVRVMF